MAFLEEFEGEIECPYCHYSNEKSTDDCSHFIMRCCSCEKKFRAFPVVTVEWACVRMWMGGVNDG